MILAIFAVDEKGGMGNDGYLPWAHIKEDFQWFKQTTTGHIIVMGRKSWESPEMTVKPLPNRLSVVFTNDPKKHTKALKKPEKESTGKVIFYKPLNGSIPDSLDDIQKNHSGKFKNKNIFVIGGPDVLMKSVDKIQTCLITRIPGFYHADVYLDTWDFLKDFTLKGSKPLNKFGVMLEQWERTSNNDPV